MSDIPGHLLTHPSSFSPSGNNRVSATVGNRCVLTCPSKSNITTVTWKISRKVGGPCTLGYRADQNKTDRTNCSDSMNWKFRPDRDPALEIRQVGIDHEGNYTCEVVGTEGNFHKTYHLTVLGKGLLPHFTVLQRTTSGLGHTKLLAPCTGGSMQKEEELSCWDKLSCISLIVAPFLPSLFSLFPQTLLPAAAPFSTV